MTIYLRTLSAVAFFFGITHASKALTLEDLEELEKNHKKYGVVQCRGELTLDAEDAAKMLEDARQLRESEKAAEAEVE